LKLELYAQYIYVILNMVNHPNKMLCHIRYSDYWKILNLYWSNLAIQCRERLKIQVDQRAHRNFGQSFKWKLGLNKFEFYLKFIYECIRIQEDTFGILCQMPAQIRSSNQGQILGISTIENIDLKSINSILTFRPNFYPRTLCPW
jgi:hypothetical protein